MGLLELPAELLCEIVEYRSNRIEDLKALRLVHRKFYDIISPSCFFKTLSIAVEESLGSFGDQLDVIERSPCFARNIRSFCQKLVVHVNTSSRAAPRNPIEVRPTIRLGNGNPTDAEIKCEGPNLYDRFQDGNLSRLKDIVLKISFDGHFNWQGDLWALYGLVRRMKEQSPCLRVHAYLVDIDLNWAYRPVDWLPPLHSLTCVLSKGTLQPAVSDAIARAISRSPMLHELTWVNRSQDADSTNPVLPELNAKLGNSNSLGNIESLKIHEASSFFGSEPDLSHFMGLKVLQLQDSSGNFMSDGSLWAELEEMKVNLEVIDIDSMVMTEAFINYISEVEENRLTTLRLRFEISASASGRVVGDREELESNWAMSTNFWEAIARQQDSLRELLVMPNIGNPKHFLQESNTGRKTFHLRLDGFQSWSVCGQEFAAANISFSKLEKLNAITAFMHRDDFQSIPSRLKQHFDDAGFEEFRFRDLMGSVSKCLPSLQDIRLHNIGGILEGSAISSIYNSDSEEEFERDCCPWTPLRDATSVSNRRIDSMIRSHVSDVALKGVSKVILDTQTYVGKQHPMRYVLRGGRWQRFKKARITPGKQRNKRKFGDLRYFIDTQPKQYALSGWAAQPFGHRVRRR